MKIRRIDIFHVAMPLVYPFRTAFGNTERIESVLVRMHTDSACGWGEAAAWEHPAYCPEWAAGQYLLTRERLAPLLVGQSIPSGEDLQQLLRPFKGNCFAKAALDLAWWDLHARTLGQPLWKLLGGKGPFVEVGADLGVMESVGLLLNEIEKAINAGFKRIKLKYRPGWDLEMISEVRRAFPADIFHVDCNSAYTLNDLPMLRRLDEFDLKMIEQPLMHDDLIDHATLQRQISTPICLDESITSPDRARQAIEICACRWINIKHGRVGGITNALKIHDLCEKAGVACWIGGMLESAVGQNHSIALATLSNIRYPSDIFPSNRFYGEDLARPQIDCCAPSQIKAQDADGIGVEPDQQLLDRLTIQQSRISS